MDLSQFEDAYAGVLMRSWTSEEFVKELLSRPAEALREFGLTVPDGVTVSIVRQSEGKGSVEDEFKAWNKGIADGHVKLVVPEVAPIDVSQVSDADLKGGLVGGVAVCCCCCPCCTCA
jgi:hypothetical protein